MTSTARHARNVLFGVLLMLAAGSVALPGHSLARCFGIPEEPVEEPVELVSAWYVNVTVSGEDGAQDSARFGAAEGATIFPDEGIDGYENLSDRPLLLYFETPLPETFETPLPGTRPYDRIGSALLNVSVTSDGPGERLWVLIVDYRGTEFQRFTLTWDASDVASVPSSWSLRIFPSAADPIDMRSRSELQFRPDAGQSAFTIRGTNDGAEPSTGLPAEALVFASVAYVGLVGLVLILRARRRRRTGSREAR